MVPRIARVASAALSVHRRGPRARGVVPSPALGRRPSRHRQSHPTAATRVQGDPPWFSRGQAPGARLSPLRGAFRRTGPSLLAPRLALRRTAVAFRIDRDVLGRIGPAALAPCLALVPARAADPRREAGREAKEEAVRRENRVWPDGDPRVPVPAPYLAPVPAADRVIADSAAVPPQARPPARYPQVAADDDRNTGARHPKREGSRCGRRRNRRRRPGWLARD